MKTDQDPHPEKKVTAATTDAPQEEFIRPESVPSEPESEGSPAQEREVESWKT